MFSGVYWEWLLEFTWVAKRDMDGNRLEATKLVGLGVASFRQVRRTWW